MSNAAIKWAGEHPVPTVIGVAVVGLVVLWVLGVFKGGGSSASDGGASAATSAYYAAEAQQGIAGTQLMATQIAADASTAQAKIASDTTISTADIWANSQNSINNANNQASLNMNALTLNEEYESDAEKNAANQYGLNVLNLGGAGAFAALTESGYYASH